MPTFHDRIWNAASDAKNLVEEMGVLISLTPSDTGYEDGRYVWTAEEFEVLLFSFADGSLAESIKKCCLDQDEATVEYPLEDENLAIYVQWSGELGTKVLVLGPPGMELP